MLRAWGDESRRLRPFMGMATSFADGRGVRCGCGWGARRDAERLRVPEAPNSSLDWRGMYREVGIGEGAGADDATWVDASAATSSASETSDTETVREREEPLTRPPPPPQCSRPVLAEAVAASQSPLSPANCLFASSGPSTLMLLRRPRCRSRSIPCHISSVTPKRSRHRRSWRARESGRVSGLWHIAQGEGWPP